jgi:hypothetical protein
LTAFGHIPALPSVGKAQFRGIRAGRVVFAGTAKYEPNITAPAAHPAIGIEPLAPSSNGDSRKREPPRRLFGKKKLRKKFHTRRL